MWSAFVTGVTLVGGVAFLVLLRVRAGSWRGVRGVFRPASSAATRSPGEQRTEGVVALVFAAALAAAGVVVLNLPVKCDNQEMHPGDYCQTYNRAGDSVGDRESFVERRSTQRTIGGVLLGAGVVVGAGGLWSLARGKARELRRADRVGGAAGGGDESGDRRG